MVLVTGRISDGDEYPGAYYAALGTSSGTNPPSRCCACGSLVGRGDRPPRRRRGPRPRRPATGLRHRAVVTSVPLAVYLFASVNPSGVVVGGVAAYWCAVTSTCATGRPRRRRALAGLAVVAASSR